MNIDELTIAQAKTIAAMFPQPQPAAAPHPMIGRYAVVRFESAGVHAGEVVSVSGDQIVLRNSRRLWLWHAKAGIALSGVAQFGINREHSKIDSINPEICLRGWIEIIPATGMAQESINGAD